MATSVITSSATKRPFDELAVQPQKKSRRDAEWREKLQKKTQSLFYRFSFQPSGEDKFYTLGARQYHFINEESSKALKAFEEKIKGLSDHAELTFYRRTVDSLQRFLLSGKERYGDCYQKLWSSFQRAQKSEKLAKKQDEIALTLLEQFQSDFQDIVDFRQNLHGQFHLVKRIKENERDVVVPDLVDHAHRQSFPVITERNVNFYHEYMELVGQCFDDRAFYLQKFIRSLIEIRSLYATSLLDV